MSDTRERVEHLIGLMEGELDVLKVEKRIRGRVKKQMEKSQREYYLNEQMKAIQKELGDLDEGGSELEELEKRMKAAGMTKEARDKGLGRAEQAEDDVADVGRSHGGAQLSGLDGERTVEKAQQDQS
jgi:ATP-dependent Lon protease